MLIFFPSLPSLTPPSSHIFISSISIFSIFSIFSICIFISIFSIFSSCICNSSSVCSSSSANADADAGGPSLRTAGGKTACARRPPERRRGDAAHSEHEHELGQTPNPRDLDEDELGQTPNPRDLDEDEHEDEREHEDELELGQTPNPRDLDEHEDADEDAGAVGKIFAAQARALARRLSRGGGGGGARRGVASMGNSGASQGSEVTEPHFILKTPVTGDFEGYETTVLGNGCFWGSEVGLWRMPGMYSTAVVYAGGAMENPSYEAVCTGATGHAEAVRAAWKPEDISFVDIIRQFLQSHDPTQVNGQGNDRGTQYRSIVLYTTEDQKRIAEAAIAKYQEQLGRPIATQVKPLDTFYYAEQYHQQYLARPGSRPYCSAQPLGVQLADWKSWVPEDLQEKYAPKLGEDYWEAHAPSPHCVLRQPKTPIQWPPK
ncbi:Peptide methionine sulfoxide reductase [Hondaea fermentalgiana]|uniref:peptide-methionine (S)-S-oxide reductase n=1 Tax=Hondaea fermentalgiana TaxID=2315210 RepID=A0A2R5G8M8_9STRA|nr:Peptide methionine sulfoxide reductase [Hondaea fermentalgiana]|eukprot:GBG26895.1 Peptide methionine sulfoxide reductase [Hondaea fermentalgiana]